MTSPKLNKLFEQFNQTCDVVIKHTREYKQQLAIVRDGVREPEKIRENSLEDSVVSKLDGHD